MIDLAELSSFVAAADEMHFGRAALRQHMTQPTLSRQIDALERSLKVKLFERTNRNVKLTAAGQVFLPEAKRILAQVESATNMAQRTWRGEMGVIRLGFTATAAFMDLPLILSRTAEALPGIRVLLKESTSAVQKNALLADTLDVAILRPPVDETTFAIMRLRTEKFVAALHKDDKRASRKRLVLKDFDKRPFIMYSPDGAGYSFRRLAAMFEKERINPVIDHQLDQNHAILSLVSAGLGAALVPDSLAILAFPNVVFREVEIDDGMPLEMFMAWRSQNKNPALVHFLNLCRSIADI